jgi:hypothetical protein
MSQEQFEHTQRQEYEMTVHAKLMRARLLLQSRKLNKSGHNKFAGYTYFELGDFLPAVQEIFSEVGLCGVISFNKDIATLTITDVDKGGVIEITSPMEKAQLKGCHPIQNLGAVETYTRRYLWVTAMEIVEHDALDATTGKEPPEPKVKASSLREFRHRPIGDDPFEDVPLEQHEYIKDLAEKLNQAGPDGAPSIVADEKLDNDQKIALWSLLDSKVRSAIKKANQ